ncbi:WD40-repeat-containing domain protein [Obelidium mucronatum]|nr:WD40-repeat-containing domain protein [Obelidium mucronatum]
MQGPTYAAIARSSASSVFLDADGGRHGQQSQSASPGADAPPAAPADTAPKPKPKLLKTLRCRLASPLAVLSASPDGSRGVVGGKDVLKVVAVFERELRETANLRSAGGTRLNYALTDAKWARSYAPSAVASAHLNGDIVLWDADRAASASAGKLLRVFKEHDQSVNRLSFHHADPLLLSACQDASIKLWDLRERGNSSATFEGRADKVRDVQFSPTAAFEFIAAFENGDVQKWDIRKPNEPERRWSAHFGLALTIDWHPDGNVFASAGRDKVIKFWDTKAEGRKPFQTIQTSSHVARIAWRPSSFSSSSAHQIASCSLAVDSKLSVWDLGRGYVAEWAVEEHDGPITDFLWQDSDVIWSVSKDHTFVRQDLEVAGYHPYELLPPCAGGWNQFGDYTFSLPQQHSHTPVLDNSEIRTSPPIVPLALQPIPHSGPLKQLIAVYETGGFNDVSFLQLAFQYDLGKNLSSKRKKGGSAAARLDLPRASQTWAFLQLLFGIEHKNHTSNRKPRDTTSTIRNPRNNHNNNNSNSNTRTTFPGVLSAVTPVVTTPTSTAAAAAANNWVFEDLAIPQLDREDLVLDILNFYGELGNAQMCASILMVLEGYLTRVDPGMKELWISSYVDLLYRFNAWSTATYVISRCGIPSIEARNQESTTLYTCCGFCLKPIPNAPQPGWICERCLRVTSICAICHKPVKGQFSWCHGCQHGGHLRCMVDWWFGKGGGSEGGKECASGCGHVCTL